jgi:hypothetical protein
MRKVYVVTHEPSDDVIGVFDDKAVAQQFIEEYVHCSKWLFKDDFSLEEYEVNAGIGEGNFTYAVDIYQDGKYTLSFLTTVDYVGLVRYNDIFDSYRVGVRAKDTAHAVKQAEELVKQIKDTEHLYPRLKERCVKLGNLPYLLSPRYDIHTHQIRLIEGETLIEKGEGDEQI